MNKQYGRMIDQPGTYVLDKIPDAGNFEYIYKNKNIFLKVDQYGPSFIQLNPPAGMTVIKRKERETFSPWKTYFKVGNKVVHNFDIFSAKKFKIVFAPNRAIYELNFNDLTIITTLFVDKEEQEIYEEIKFNSNKERDLICLNVANFSPLDSAMAIWDKQEWYETTDVNNSLFITKHYSVNGDKKDRRTILMRSNADAISVQNSYERLLTLTKNFTIIPKNIGELNPKQVSCYEQVSASLINISSNGSFKTVIKVINDEEEIDEKELLNSLNTANFNKIIDYNLANYNKVISRRNITTPDDNFNRFVNYFLPLQLSWVMDLDRGWPTGMRGSRDCANDFLGYLAYDLPLCRSVIKTLFDNERFEDGWFPRQIPFGNSNKYDLRPFSDSGAFVIELIYEYLCYSNDYSILSDIFTYYSKEKSGTGLEHLIKAACYYTLSENIGEHGLIKLHGGDWLDCLNKVGLKNRGETVMVTCQALLAFKQVGEILKKYGDEYKNILSLFEEKTKFYKENIIKHSYLKDEKFYKGIFADDGNWYFSNKDLDGNKRVYIPTNAYTIISEINPENDGKVVKEICKNNEIQYGFKLFSVPFGNPNFEGIGKMGTGDFQPFMFENGAVYNHGANLFFARALAKIKDHKTFYRVINYALPYNPKFHPESVSYLPSYACTNAYNLIPAFYGRSGMCFLTGSIAMIERSIYSWMFGLDYHMDYLRISPCLPKEYRNSLVQETYDNKKIIVKYHGFGGTIIKTLINDKELDLINGEAIIDKKYLTSDMKIEVFLK